MVGDFTRLRYDPRRRYSSVQWQQGRVLLDSDWGGHADPSATTKPPFGYRVVTVRRLIAWCRLVILERMTKQLS
jgi:Family of unknown function (DUF6519)